MGTPDFAVSTLESLLDSAHEVTAVFTRIDKPRNRGKKITFSPVKEVANQHRIPVYQPTSLRGENEEEVLRILREHNPDCIVVVAYGMILPQSVLDFPKYGCLNVHASLLPKYRGAAPINRCIMSGESESGITIIQMDSGIDTGDMLLSEKVEISPDMNASQLHDVLAKVGGGLIVRALDGIETLLPIKQNHDDSTYAAMFKKDECRLDCSHSAKKLCDFIRGLADSPCAFTFWGESGKRLKIYRAVAGEAYEQAGIPLKCGKNGEETIILTEIQPEGGKRMSATEFLKGFKDFKGGKSCL